MKYLSLLLLMTGSIFLSCNDVPKKSTEVTTAGDTTKKDEMKIMIPGMFCYSSITGKDSVFLKTEIFPNVVTGNLTYKLFEKDSNKGTIDGALKGDTLIADYTFMSEGRSSVRQVAFIIKDSVATEGYGDMEEKDGKMIFKDPGKLDFSNGIKLQKTECPIQ